MDANEFLAKEIKPVKPGKHGKISEARILRFEDEFNLITMHTLDFALGKVAEDKFVKLSDVKKFVAQKKEHDLDVESELAEIHDDMVKLCVTGINVGGKPVQLTAKTVGTNRVAYFNLQAVRELVSKTKDKKVLQTINSRMQIINKLQDRPGYAHK